MAYLTQYDASGPFDFMKKQGLNPDGTPATSGAGGSGSAGGAGAGGGAAASAISPTPQASTGSGQYTNFQRVLDANAGQGQAMAGQLAGQASNQANAAQTSLGNLQGTYGQQAAAGTVHFNPALTPPAPAPAPATVTRTYYTPQQAGYGLGPTLKPTQGVHDADTAKTVTTPVTPYVDPYAHYTLPQSPYGNTTGAQTALNTGYTGPASLADTNGYAGMQAQYNTAQDSLNALGSSAGLQALLQQQYGGGGNYSQGANQFDALLAGGQGGQALRDTQAKYAGLQQALADATANTAPTTNAQAATDASKAAATQYLQAAGQWTNDQNTYAQAYNQLQDQNKAQAQAQQDAYQKYLDNYGGRANAMTPGLGTRGADSFQDWQTKQTPDYQTYAKWAAGHLGMNPSVSGYQQWVARGRK